MRSFVIMLSELTSVPDAALPLERFKAHLRLGRGFGDDSLQDDLLIGFLRAAVVAIEARTGKVLLTRAFAWQLRDWQDRGGQRLPLVPVVSLDQVALLDAAGAETLLDPARFRLDPDPHVPMLCPTGALLPAVAANQRLQITLTAGMAPDWDSLPADLGQAVMLLAAHYYEYRDDTALSSGCMPFGVTSLIQRYRVLRLSLGAVQ